MKKINLPLYFIKFDTEKLFYLTVQLKTNYIKYESRKIVQYKQDRYAEV